MQPPEKGEKAKGGLGRIAFWLVVTVILFGLITQRMMLSNESSALELLTSESNKFMDMLHRNHGDAIIKADAPRTLPEALSNLSLRSAQSGFRAPKSAPAAPLIKDMRSFAEKLADYVDAKPEGTTLPVLPKGAAGTVAATVAGAKRSMPRGQKVKQKDLVEAEEETVDKQAARLSIQHPPPKVSLSLPGDAVKLSLKTPVTTVPPPPPPLLVKAEKAKAVLPPGAEDETAEKQAARLGMQHPPPKIKLDAAEALSAMLPAVTVVPVPAASAVKPKPKPKKGPPSPLDGLPPPPDPNYHPRMSPRPGTDISLQNQLSALRCPNQSACIVPELQLEVPLKVCRANPNFSMPVNGRIYQNNKSQPNHN